MYSNNCLTITNEPSLSVLALAKYDFLANHLILLSHLKGMDVDWPYQRRVLGDTLSYNCPPSTMTWKTYVTSQQVIIIQ
jgi:hypothetical protein